MKRGELDQTTEEFNTFKRQNITRWGAILYLISCLEKFISQYNITFAYISAQKLIEYGELDLEKYDEYNFFDCIVNR